MRCRFLFQADLGDPISSIFVNELGCMAGSMLGKVLLYSFQEHQVEILSAFSDEGVRGLYLDQDVAFATLTDACKGWQRTPPHMHVSSLNFRSLDKKKHAECKKRSAARFLGLRSFSHLLHSGEHPKAGTPSPSSEAL